MQSKEVNVFKDLSQTEVENGGKDTKGSANVNLQVKVNPSVKEIFDNYAKENGVKQKDLMEDMVSYFFSSDQVVSLNAKDEIEAAQSALVNAMGQFSAIVNKANVRVSEIRDKNRKELKKKDEIISGLEKQYVQIKDQMDVVIEENEGFNQVKAQILEEKQAVEEQKVELEYKLKALEDVLSKKTDVCEEQALEITKLKENITRLQKDLELSNSTLAEINKTFTLVEDKVKANMEEQQARIKEIYAQNEAEIQKVVTLKNEQISGLEDQIKMLKENLEMKINLAVEKKELEFLKEINALKEENKRLKMEKEVKKEEEKKDDHQLKL